MPIQVAKKLHNSDQPNQTEEPQEGRAEHVEIAFREHLSAQVSHGSPAVSTVRTPPICPIVFDAAAIRQHNPKDDVDSYKPCAIRTKGLITR